MACSCCHPNPHYTMSYGQLDARLERQEERLQHIELLLAAILREHETVMERTEW